MSVVLASGVPRRLHILLGYGGVAVDVLVEVDLRSGGASGLLVAGHGGVDEVRSRRSHQRTAAGLDDRLTIQRRPHGAAYVDVLEHPVLGVHRQVMVAGPRRERDL